MIETTSTELLAFEKSRERFERWKQRSEAYGRRLDANDTDFRRLRHMHRRATNARVAARLAMLQANPLFAGGR